MYFFKSLNPNHTIQWNLIRNSLKSAVCKQLNLESLQLKGPEQNHVFKKFTCNRVWKDHSNYFHYSGEGGDKFTCASQSPPFNKHKRLTELQYAFDSIIASVFVVILVEFEKSK